MIKSESDYNTQINSATATFARRDNERDIEREKSIDFSVLKSFLPLCRREKKKKKKKILIDSLDSTSLSISRRVAYITAMARLANIDP